MKLGLNEMAFRTIFTIVSFIRFSVSAAIIEGYEINPSMESYSWNQALKACENINGSLPAVRVVGNGTTSFGVWNLQLGQNQCFWLGAVYELVQNVTDYSYPNSCCEIMYQDKRGTYIKDCLPCSERYGYLCASDSNTISWTSSNNRSSATWFSAAEYCNKNAHGLPLDTNAEFLQFIILQHPKWVNGVRRLNLNPKQGDGMFEFCFCDGKVHPKCPGKPHTSCIVESGIMRTSTLPIDSTSVSSKVSNLAIITNNTVAHEVEASFAAHWKSETDTTYVTSSQVTNSMNSPQNISISPTVQALATVTHEVQTPFSTLWKSDTDTGNHRSFSLRINTYNMSSTSSNPVIIATTTEKTETKCDKPSQVTESVHSPPDIAISIVEAAATITDNVQTSISSFWKRNTEIGNIGISRSNINTMNVVSIVSYPIIITTTAVTNGKYSAIDSTLKENKQETEFNRPSRVAESMYLAQDTSTAAAAPEVERSLSTIWKSEAETGNKGSSRVHIQKIDMSSALPVPVTITTRTVTTEKHLSTDQTSNESLQETEFNRPSRVAESMYLAQDTSTAAAAPEVERSLSTVWKSETETGNKGSSRVHIQNIDMSSALPVPVTMTTRTVTTEKHLSTDQTSNESLQDTRTIIGAVAGGVGVLVIIVVIVIVVVFMIRRSKTNEKKTSDAKKTEKPINVLNGKRFVNDAYDDVNVECPDTNNHSPIQIENHENDFATYTIPDKGKGSSEVRQDNYSIISTSENDTRDRVNVGKSNQGEKSQEDDYNAKFLHEPLDEHFENLYNIASFHCTPHDKDDGNVYDKANFNRDYRDEDTCNS